VFHLGGLVVIIRSYSGRRVGDTAMDEKGRGFQLKGKKKACGFFGGVCCCGGGADENRGGSRF
jgi:hypothetical protein